MPKVEQKKKKVDFDMTQFSVADREEMSRMYDETMKNFVVGSIVPGTVLEVRDNEALVDIGYKSEGVIPGEEFADLKAVSPGDKLDVLLEEIEDADGMVVLSKQRAEEKITWENVVATCTEGAVVDGIVRARVKGGMIVDVSGVDAFLPGSQVDVTPVRDMEQLIGNTYQFRVVKINPDRRNIVVSRRELLEELLKEKKKKLLAEISIGQLRAGAVKNITDFGVFVDLDGMDGLLHITDMSWGRVNHPSEMVRVGDTIEVMILDIDLERERVSLGLKQKTTNPWNEIDAKYPVGTRVQGRVVNLVPYGAFVEIEEGVEGLVHVSEISWTRRIAKASDVLAVGDEVGVVVLSLNKDEQKIALGMRQTENNPWDSVRDKYPVGQTVTGTVRNFTAYGAFIQLQDDIDGMIHVSDMSWTRKINHPSEVLNKGDNVTAVVLEVDPDNQRISLGLKQAQEDPWSTVTMKYDEGQRVCGKVTKIASFGAFVQIEDGIEGLVHISQISEQHVENITDVLHEGQEVEARVVKVDAGERRIGLSITAAGLPDEEFERQKDDMLTGLRPGENMVDLAGAFDDAFEARSPDDGGADWHPGGSK
jgi:small subunit ribosomal protein S1